LNFSIRSDAFRGAGVILVASLAAGIGNAVTGFTAHEYVSSGSLLPGVDIALANTVGGLAFVVGAIFARRSIGHPPGKSVEPTSSTRLLLRNRRSFLGGAFKGANSCLFVFSTIYIVATQSLVFESTFVIWSLILGIVFLGTRTSAISAGLKSLLLFVGVLLVSGQLEMKFGSTISSTGALFSLLAGVSFALYLFSWSFVTKDLTSVGSKLAATGVLLSVSTLTIMVLSEALSLAVLGVWWVPFASLRLSDVALQTLNGVFVIGVVYLLVTIGMNLLRNSREGASFIASAILSFMIPLTLLSEFAIGKFYPTNLELVGLLLFMIGFILISANLSQPQDARSTAAPYSQTG
jgi:drug/metabolite transporter (DMT)-like permease